MRNRLILVFGFLILVNVRAQISKFEILLSEYEINSVAIVDTFFSIQDIPKLFKINNKYFKVTKKKTKKYWYEGTSTENQYDPFFSYSLRFKKYGIYLEDEFIPVKSFDDTTTLSQYKISVLKFSKKVFRKTIIHFKDTIGQITTIVLGKTSFEELASSNVLKFITKENIKRPEDLNITSKKVFATATLNRRYSLLFKNYGTKKRQKWIIEHVYVEY